MKEKIVPYIVGDLHSTIDYAKLIALQANGIEQKILEQPQQKVLQKTIINRQNQRQNRNREFSSANRTTH